MSKKEKYKKLAKKALRECLNMKEYSQRCVFEQISSLESLVSGDLENMENSKELEKYLKIACPFFKEIKEKEEIFEFWQILEKVFRKEYNKLTKKKYTEIQTISLLCSMESFWGYTKLQDDVMKKIKKFSKCEKLVAKLFFLQIEAEDMFDIFKEF